MNTHVVCPICGNIETRKLFEKQRCTFVQCINDGLVYIKPQPSREELQKIYDTGGKVFYEIKDQFLESYDSYGNKFYEIPESISASAYYPIYRRQFSFFRQSNRLLEIGAAGGTFLVQCRNDGWEVHGVELSASSSQFAREEQGLDIATGTIHDARYPTDFFDVVVAWQTLEHVPDPREVVTEIFRILRPRGFFVFSVPCWNGLTIHLIKEKYRYVGRDHLFYFSTHNICQMLTDIGFSDVRVKTLGFNPIVCYKDAFSGRDKSIGQKTNDGKVDKPLLHRAKPSEFLKSIYRLYSNIIGAFNLGDFLLGKAVK